MSIQLVQFSVDIGTVAVNPQMVTHVMEQFCGGSGIEIHLRGVKSPVLVQAASLLEVVDKLAIKTAVLRGR